MNLDGLNSTVIIAWDNAKAALDRFGSAQGGVLSTLESLALKMNDLVQNTNHAAEAMANLNKERENQAALERQILKDKLSAGGGLSGTQFGKGSQKQLNHSGTGSVRKTGKSYHSGKLKPDEIESVLQVGEGVIPVNKPRRALDVIADFINSNADVKSLLGQSSSASSEPSYRDFESLAGNTTNLSAPDPSKYERNDYNTPISVNLGNVQIMGNADTAVMDKWLKSREGQLKNMFTKDVFETINKNHRMSGERRSTKHFGL